MICALLLDLDDSPDFPGNNGMALGRPLAAYPLIAAKSSRHVRRRCVVTDSPPVKAAALQYDALIIDPPAGPRTAKALLSRGLRDIQEELKAEGQALELLAVLFAHAPAVTAELLDAGIEALQARPELDCAVSVSAHNRLNPFLARREGKAGLLEAYAGSGTGDGEVWYPDWGVQVLRPRLAENPAGPEPLPWLSGKVLPLKQWGAGPVDYQWQVPGLEYWLKKHGVSDNSAALELKPKPQPAPKADRR